MQEKIESLKRVVQWGLDNSKTNMIVDLDVLAAVLEASTLNAELLAMLEGFLHHVRVMQGRTCQCDLCIKARAFLASRATPGDAPRRSTGHD